jgi:predicted enzyme related to lactoylglutathione lyase
MQNRWCSAAALRRAAGHSASLALVLVAMLTGACASGPQRVLPPLLAEPTNWVAPGKFVWIDLITQDPAASQDFYRTLFGWTYETQDGYTRISHMGRPIAGMVEARNVEDGSEWLGSLSVTDVDEAVAIAIANGAIIERQPIDVPQRGRMALISDPEGALLLVLRATSGDPQDEPPAVGAWLWRELWSNTPTNAEAFYQELVAYTFETTELNGQPYSVFKVGEQPRAGVVHAPAEIHPTWLPYVRVAEIGPVVAQAEQLGARIFAHDDDMAIIVDPIGAPFGIQVWDPPDPDADAQPDATPAAESDAPTGESSGKQANQ